MGSSNQIPSFSEHVAGSSPTSLHSVFNVLIHHRSLLLPFASSRLCLGAVQATPAHRFHSLDFVHRLVIPRVALFPLGPYFGNSIGRSRSGIPGSSSFSCPHFCHVVCNTSGRVAASFLLAVIVRARAIPSPKLGLSRRPS